MKRIMFKIGIIISIFMMALPVQPVQAATSPSIYTLKGLVFQDINTNGVLDLNNLEIGLKGFTVSLYTDLEVAKSNGKALKSYTTSIVGEYLFTGLKEGKYYLKYTTSASDYVPVNNDKTVIDTNGKTLSGIVEVNISKGDLIQKMNLPVQRYTNLLVSPFNDINWNGVLDGSEKIISNKTMIIFEVQHLAKAIQDGSLASIDVSTLLNAGLINGSVDLMDGMYIRTTKNNQAIQLNNVPSGVYVVLRSPINLTLNDILANTKNLELIIQMLQNGDVTQILENNSLLSTNDINTNNDAVAIKALQQTVSGIVDLSNKVDYEKILGSKSTTIASAISTLNGINMLLKNLPVYRIGVVTHWGDVYDVTGLKVKTTNNFYFGIREYATISGELFVDSDYNGSKGLLERKGNDATISIYDANGKVVASSTTTSSNLAYSFTQLPFNTNLYVVVDTNMLTTTVAKDSLPVALQDKNVVAVYNISEFAENVKETLNIGVVPTTLNNVSILLKNANYTNKTADIEFKNSDKTTASTVYYTLNNGAVASINLAKAPLFGSAKATTVTVTNINAQGTNDLACYALVGIYKIPLLNIKF